ncbi:J domain-containing protein [Novosphingobium sp. Gsoil 351]|uniref:J domain-containing protein n=1 Tax=Novosphingobium sp. Gsoil 351 TaxID=2675225 RepID=UPI0012B4A15D|nr:J domain-containing protein [Novosphingobium sp. Gsoil 351]QGN54853.1 molecular chaperone DnaJ [Novosphingobium sp. Gsoil 351]
MSKLIVLLILASVLSRMLAGKWPWELFRAASASSDEAQARAVLGVVRGASAADIAEAHRRLIARVHPDRGGSSERVHEANAARDLLLARLPGNPSSSRD